MGKPIPKPTSTKKVILCTISIIALLIIVFVRLKLLTKTKKVFNNIANQFTIQKTKNTLCDSEITIQNFQIQEADRGKIDKFILKGKIGKLFKKENKIKCTDSSCIISHKNKKIAQISAPLTTFYLKKNRVEMEGGIKSEILNNSASHCCIN